MGGYRRRSDAPPTGQVIDALSTRWGVSTIDAIYSGQRRFTELHRGIPGISRKVLVHTLRGMQRDGFVTGPVSDPERSEYLLTDLGYDLVALIAAIRIWSGDRSLAPGQVIATLSARWLVPAIEAIDDGYTHFNRLQRRLDGISHKVLIGTLRSLQRDDFVQGPLTGADNTEYRLTGLGADVLGVVRSIGSWSADRWPELTSARAEFDRHANSRAATSDDTPVVAVATG